MSWYVLIEKNGKIIDAAKIGSNDYLYSLSGKFGFHIIDSIYNYLTDEEMIAGEKNCIKVFNQDTFENILRFYFRVSEEIFNANPGIINDLNNGIIYSDYSDETWMYSIAITISKFVRKARAIAAEFIFRYMKEGEIFENRSK
ncbi:MAG: hypothetical protein QXY18_06065 [Nitrososphaerota archaeon]